MIKKFEIEKFEKGQKEIIFFGSQHGRDISQILNIQEQIENLKPEIILIEGNYDKSIFSSKEEAISKGGELGFTSFLAKQKKIKLLSNDPSAKEDINFLSKKYGKGFSFLYFFLRNRDFYNQNLPMPKNKIEEITINNLTKESEGGNYDFTIENLKQIFLKIFGRKFNPNKDYSDYFNPTLPNNKFTIATRELTEFRDKFMLELIKKLLGKYDKFFIIKGEHHLKKTKEEIKKLIRWNPKFLN